VIVILGSKIYDVTTVSCCHVTGIW